MCEPASDVADWDGPFAVASVVAVRGSAPREVGAALAIHPDGRVVGSVSGGCVEGAVYELALSVPATGTPRLARFGYSAQDAFAVGLTCGGELEVFVQVVTPEIRSALRAVRDGRPVVRAVRDGRPVVLTRSLETGGAAISFPEQVISGSSVVDGHLVESWGTAPRLLVFGAIDYAAAVARQGKFLGYHVTVCDARPVFATPERFPAADEVVVDWPHRYPAATPGRRHDRRVRAHPRPEVRRAAADGGAAPAAGLRRRARLAAHPPGPPGPAARGGPDRGGAGPPAFPDRPGPGRPDARGDGRVHRRRDRRGAARRSRPAAVGHRHPDPQGGPEWP